MHKSRRGRGREDRLPGICRGSAQLLQDELLDLGRVSWTVHRGEGVRARGLHPQSDLHPELLGTEVRRRANCNVLGDWDELQEQLLQLGLQLWSDLLFSRRQPDLRQDLVLSELDLLDLPVTPELQPLNC